jgi:hypothetical protein
MKLTTNMIIDDEYIMFGNRITRFEVIDNNGRSYTKNEIKEIKFQLQDDGQTLKAFVHYKEEEEICID